MTPLISSPTGLLAGIAAMVAVSLLLQKVKFFKSIGPALTCIILGILLSNLNILPHSADTFNPFFTYAIPLALTMFLLSVDFKEWVKLSRQPLFAMFLAVLSVSVVAIVAGLALAPKIDEGWKIAGMFVGTYTGGSSNLAAIGTGLEVKPTTFATANAADYVIGIPMIVFFFAVPALIARSKTFQKLWPYSLKEHELFGGDETQLLAQREWSVIDIAVLFALGFAVTAVSTHIAGYFDKTVAGAVRIISVTTLSLVLAQFKPIRQIKGSMDLGLFVSLFYLAAIGLAIDLKEFLGSAPLVTLYCFFVCVGSLLLHTALCRLFKISYQHTLISIVASIADGTTSALVASSGGWSGIIGTAVILGAIGNALGNYLGIGVAYFLKTLLGL